MSDSEKIYQVLNFLGELIYFFGSFVLIAMLLFVIADILVSSGKSNALYYVAFLYTPMLHYFVFGVD